MAKIVLASKSPRRQELLKNIGITEFDIRVPEADESYPSGLTPQPVVEHISRVLDVSAVAFPAYPQTSIQVASEGDALDSARASLESARKELEEQRAKQAEDERRTAALERLNNLIGGK